MAGRRIYTRHQSRIAFGGRALDEFLVSKSEVGRHFRGLWAERP